LPPRFSIQISKIADITALPDPPWLAESNKAAAVAFAEALLDKERRGN
jgi:hypothetical protein